MPADARVWVYQSNRVLSDTEVSAVNNAGMQFVSGWKAHGANLTAGFDVVYNHFIVISIDETKVKAGGCSLDDAAHFINALEKHFNLNLLDRMAVAYRYGDEIKTCHLNNLIKELTLAGLHTENEVGGRAGDVIVFNNMVTTKNQFDKEWEIKLKQSWQSRVLPK